MEKRRLKKKKKWKPTCLLFHSLKRLQKAKIEEQFSRFLDMFKKIEINISFVEALTQMPNYAKFFKDILNNKRMFAEERVVNLTTTCSAVIQKSLPVKM